MINQVSYSFVMSGVMETFRYLLKPDTWATGFKGFKLAKEKIREAVTNVVKHFEVGRQTCLATDWHKRFLPDAEGVQV